MHAGMIGSMHACRLLHAGSMQAPCRLPAALHAGFPCSAGSMQAQAPCRLPAALGRSGRKQVGRTRGPCPPHPTLQVDGGKAKKGGGDVLPPVDHSRMDYEEFAKVGPVGGLHRGWWRGSAPWRSGWLPLG